jgi:GTP-binding protein
VLALNKIDAINDEEMREELMDMLEEESGVRPLPLSGATGEGLAAVLDRLIEAIGPVGGTSAESAHSSATDEETPWSPL